MFALAVVTYFYLRSQSDAWPIERAAAGAAAGARSTRDPAARQRLAEPAGQARRRARSTGAACSCWLTRLPGRSALAFLVVRVLRIRALKCRWDSDAYGSIVWMLLALHTTHLVTDTCDTTVLDGADLHRPARRQALRRRQRERDVLVLRRRQLAADLRGHLLGAARLAGRTMRPGPPCCVAPLLALASRRVLLALVTPSCGTADRLACTCCRARLRARCAG